MVSWLYQWQVPQSATDGPPVAAALEAAHPGKLMMSFLPI